jgi:nucleotide-binding universal stress UspA family protein
MVLENKIGYTSALNDFHSARQKANMEEVMAFLTGRSINLLPYDEVRTMLRANESGSNLLEDIPIDAIIGSVGRYLDFTRDFLPRKDEDQARWTNLKMAVEELSGLPPIEVYQVGEAYFIRDGHHRVSIAKHNNATHIQAYVTKVNLKVPLRPEDKIDDIILKAEKTEFLLKTQFDTLLPDEDITLTAPGGYNTLVEHISVHQYFMGLDFHRTIEQSEAVIHWYQTVYQPFTLIIRQKNLLKDFPGRTEADLYLWLSKYKFELSQTLGLNIDAEKAALEYTNRYGKRPDRVIKRFYAQMIEKLTPDPLENEPKPGTWRRERPVGCEGMSCLFENILVAVTGDETGWMTVEFAVEIAKREQAWLGGLHVISPNKTNENQAIIEQTFDQYLQKAGVQGKISFEKGPIAKNVFEHSLWADLLIVRLAYPPPLDMFPRLDSGLRQLIRRCKLPILAVPPTQFNLEHILLAFDGSPKSKEALYLAAYLCGRWQSQLVVLTVHNPVEKADLIIAEAKSYLEEQNITAQYITRAQNPVDTIFRMSQRYHIDFIIMGGYGASLIKEIFTGSTVDRILAARKYPVLICK